MANPAIGEIRCPFTGEISEVCRAKSGKFPMYYRNSQVGIIHGKASGFQDWLLDNATMFGPKKSNVDETETPEPEESHKVPGEEPEERESGIFDWLFPEDEEGES